MTGVRRYVAFCAALVICSTVVAGELAVKVTVREPAGVARVGEPASGGVPFMKGQVKKVSELALFDVGGKQVPAQFTKLAPYEDGSVQWALVDVMTDLPANGAAEFVVKRAKNRIPPRALDIKQGASAVTFSTGKVSFVVDVTTGDVLSDVTLLGKRAADDRPVAKVVTMAVTDPDGKVYPAARPARTKWEYLGPVRATLRVDGVFKGHPMLSYCVRVTAWAGSGAVRIDHSIRNSNPKRGNDVKIKSATLSVDLATDGVVRGRGRNWLAMGDGKVGVLATERHTGGCFPGGDSRRVKARYKLEGKGKALTVWAVPEGKGGKGVSGYGDGYFALADCAHKDTEIWLDVYAGAREPVASATRVKTLISKLLALADPAWISETAALSVGKFGTLDDEIACYKKWGWKGWDDAKKLAAIKRPHDPYAFVGKLFTHNDSESDSAMLGLLMYVRTGERGWFDLGEAWARYHKTHYVPRTDGFVHDGFRHVRSAVTQHSKRSCKGLRFGWYSPKVYNWADSRACMCHTWSNGMFDYFCLTGDWDALEGGLDIAELAAITYPDKKNAPGTAVGLKRSWGRQFKAVTRAYQATRDRKWRKAMGYFIDCLLKAPNRHPSGLYANTGRMDGFVKKLPPRLKKYCEDNGITWKVAGREVTVTDKAGVSWKIWSSCQSFEFAACAEAVARAAEILDHAELKKVAVGLARGARDVYWSKRCNHHGLKYAVFGLPHRDKAYDPGEWDDAHKSCPGPNGGRHSGYHSRFYTDIAARAYSLTNDPKWLDFAKTVWNRGSKRRNWTGSQAVADDAVAAFAGHRPPQGDGVDIRNCSRLFYEAARMK
jgi:exo-rhamnogalacturonan lyase-like protein